MTKSPALDKRFSDEQIALVRQVHDGVTCARLPYCLDCYFTARLVALERVNTAALAWRDARSQLYFQPRPDGAEKAYHLAVDELYRALATKERP